MDGMQLPKILADKIMNFMPTILKGRTSLENSKLN
jgi:hypothetical protein